MMSFISSSNYTLNPNLPFPPSSKPFRPPQFRVFSRPRFKKRNHQLFFASLPSPSPSPFENLFQSLITQYPSVNSLDLITPALGFASGAALYLSRFKSQKKPAAVTDIGEWILFSSPTPFNRFVLLRCPTVSFRGGDDDVSERLVTEEKHYVSINSGRIEVKEDEEEEGEGFEGLSYQRVCVTGQDGGVVSLDWPSNLDLEEERGLDSTLLLVPGTTRGSMDKNVRLFVVEALRRGFFPVVMNPRGCALSPLTTPRLFTAADSDDICTAINYITKARPWTTLMAVGWGYGANMLTKYLAEVGERTPLTAATCIDNPFDLDEATRTSPYHVVTDQKLTDGLIDILQTNKALFQGKTKGFDVKKAMSAKSVREFEEAISMVSYGFGAIEDFYSKSSSRNVIKDIKIPVLFIQSDNGMVPVFSVPRNLIAENPYTSLLMCSCLPSTAIDTDRSAMSWCQLLTIEWLTAVELGLLKGRHPLLTDIDVAINPSKGLAVVEEIRSDKNDKGRKLLDLTRSDAFNGYSVDPTQDLLEESGNDANLHFRSKQGLKRSLQHEGMNLPVKNGSLQQTKSTEANLTEDGNVGSVDSEKGHVLQTAQVVINMLDITMPGALNEEKKKKVLTAVSQGETLMKALEDAVPEDVRGKLTDAVTGILNARGSDLKFDRVLRIRQAPEASFGKKNQEKPRGLTGTEGMSEDQSSLNQMKKTSSSVDGVDNTPSVMGEPAERAETEVPPLEKSPNLANLAQSQELSDEVGFPGSSRKGSGEPRDNNNTNEELKGKTTPDINHSGKGFETGSKPDPRSHPDGSGSIEAAAVAEQKNSDSGIAQIDTKEENNIQKVEQKSQDLSNDQSKMASSDAKEDPALPPMSSEHLTIERDGDDNEKKDNKTTQQISQQTNSTNFDASATAFSVSQALDALTGMDDSTQVAVNSVFGVIENMLSQLEQSSNNTGEDKDGKDVEHKLGEKQESNSQSMDSSTSGGASADDLQNTEYLESESCHTEGEQTQSLGTTDGSSVFNSQDSNSIDCIVQKESKNSQLIDKGYLIDGLDGHKHVNGMPQNSAVSSYGDSPNDEHLRKCLVSKVSSIKSLDLDTTTALLLDYFPEEGQWKLLEQPQNMENTSVNIETSDEAGCKMEACSSAKSSDAQQYIKPPYVILDSEKQQEPVKEGFITTDNLNKTIDTNDESGELIQFMKKTVLDSLKTEVGRKLNAAELNEIKSKLAVDLEHVANAISLAVLHSKVEIYTESQVPNVKGDTEKVGTLDGEHIIRVISSTVQETGYLRHVMPVGVIVGTILAALRKYFNIAKLQDNDQRGSHTHEEEEKPGKLNCGNVSVTEIVQVPEEKTGQTVSQTHCGEEKPGQKNCGNVTITEIDQVPEEKTSSEHSMMRDMSESESGDSNKNTVMVGAVTAALGASAFLMEQKGAQQGDGTAERSSSLSKMKDHNQKGPKGLGDDKNQNNLVTSLAEKAMSVAGPVVPTKEDGEVDQERLVSMLADLGQKGGFLKLVGKVALLWGGIRGAMSLTDRLISFLRIAERPLFHRIFGFIGMILVLWSPVAIPLLPTLLHGWTAKTPSRFAEFACIIGLYIATMILIMLWGKRIRGYKNAFEQYGLDLKSPRQKFELLKGFFGGVVILFSIHAVNAFLGCASFSWPRTPPSFDAMTWFKVYGQMFLVVLQGTIMASGIALVEELLFRAWLPQEIAVDLGYHHGIIISGLVFSLLQRSLLAIPGLWLLSLSLSGARQRNGGSLAIPIGIRTGMMASTFVLQKGALLTYYNSSKGNIPLWVAGTHPFQPFSGVVGLVFSLLLAILLYPRQTPQKREAQE